MNMKTRIFSVYILLLAGFFISCGSGDNKDQTPATFCDTDCSGELIADSANIPEKSFVRITMVACQADSITWGNNKMDAYRQMKFDELAGKELTLNEKVVKIHIFGTDYAWVQFNSCKTGQGFIAKLPFNKTDNIYRKTGAFNPADPAYKVHESLVAYTDRGNIFVEEMATGKKAMMTFGAETDLEYTAMHETVESVEITPTRVKARVRIGKEWKDLEKEITLE